MNWNRNSGQQAQILLQNSLEEFLNSVLKICGYRVSGWIVITNKRVVEVKSTYNCWCIESSKEIKYVLPSSVKEVGYTKVISCGCCCPVINFYYEAHTQRTQILISEGEAEAQRIVDAFYAAIAAANK